MKAYWPVRPEKASIAASTFARSASSLLRASAPTDASARRFALTSLANAHAQRVPHFSTLTAYPDPLRAALLAEAAGADGITAHLREDRRHIRDEDVAARWVRLVPRRDDTDEAIDVKCRRLLTDPERLQLIRSRLSNLSWLMRCLAEPIARRANREDACKGRFWEGRFKAQRLCDERALLAAMAYVDLNPIRADMARCLEDCTHTSVAVRMAHAGEATHILGNRLGLVMGVLQPPMQITNADYLQLLDWTGRQLAPGKRGRIIGVPPACLHGISVDPRRWTTRVRGIGSGYWRAVGSAEQLVDLALCVGQRWMKGLRFAERLG